MNSSDSPYLSQDRVLLTLALAILLLLTAVAMLARPMTPVDETRYVGVAWEMWLRGDFLVPFKNGQPYSHKPPLMMWMFQAGWALFGVNEWWPRMVSPLFSAGGIWLTYTLAKRLWPDRVALSGYAVIVLASCLVWAISSTWVMFDVMLAFFVLIGMHGTVIAANGHPFRGFALLALSIGLGALTKGPVILLQVLPVVVLAPWWHPGLRWARWYGGMLIAVIAGAALALAWAIPAGVAGGEAYQKAIFWGQTANRMVESFAHQRPIWWYLALMPLLLFPWFVWPTLWGASRDYVKQGLDRGGRFCIAWSVPVLIAFSLISGKQVHYLMPLFPAFALLVARIISAERGDEQKNGGLWLPALLMVIAGLAMWMIALKGVPLPHDLTPFIRSIWPGLILAGGGIGAYFLVRVTRRAVVVLALLGVAFYTLIQLAIAPTIYPAYDVRPIALAIHRAQNEGHLVAHAGKYHDQYHFFGRLQQPLLEQHRQEIRAWLKQHPADYAVIYFKNKEALKNTVPIMSQRYRGRIAALLDAKNALKVLAFTDPVNTGPDTVE